MAAGDVEAGDCVTIWPIGSLVVPGCDGANGDAGPTGNSQLYVFDTKERKLVLVSGGVATVIARGAMLWWSTGDNETAEWHALDLRTLR